MLGQYSKFNKIKCKLLNHLTFSKASILRSLSTNVPATDYKYKHSEYSKLKKEDVITYDQKYIMRYNMPEKSEFDPKNDSKSVNEHENRDFKKSIRIEKIKSDPKIDPLKSFNEHENEDLQKYIQEINDVKRNLDSFSNDKTKSDPINDPLIKMYEEIVEVPKYDKLAKEQELESRQIRKENEQISESVAKYTETFKNLSKIGRSTSIKSVQKLLLGWYDPLVEALNNEIKEIKSGLPSKDRNQYGPYLFLLPVEKLAVITLDTTLNCIIRTGNAGEKLTKVTLEIADIIEAEVNIQKMKRSSFFDYYQQRLVPSENNKANIKKFNSNLRRILKEDGDGWAPEMKVKIGSALVNLLIKVTKLEEFIIKPAAKCAEDVNIKPIVANISENTVVSEEKASVEEIKSIDLRGIIYTKNFRDFGKKHVKKCGFLTLAPELYTELVAKKAEFMIPRYLPMLVAPTNWDSTKFNFGCYRVMKAPLMKAISQSQIQAVKHSDIKDVLVSLDYLGKISWKINGKLLQVITDVCENKMQIGDIPSAFDLPLPERESCYRSIKVIREEKIRREAAMLKKKQKREKSSKYKLIENLEDNVNTPIAAVGEVLETDITSDESNPTVAVVAAALEEDTIEIDENELVFDEKYYNSMKSKVLRKNAELHSLRCDLNIKLKIVREFANDVIYFPHNLDFRGRAYPIPPNFSHLGSDLCRSLLLFNKTKPLGENGLNWLKIHLSNLFGNNKITMNERIAWVDEHMNEIRDSVNNPINGNKWWNTAENPFQALATCIEIISAIDSGDPSTYECGLPIHQDGSCNGLQHYAGLGRDNIGGASVNLVNSEAPQDVYSKVLEKVLKKIDDHALIALDSEDPILRQKGVDARLVRHVVNRKVIKQTVMTSVYGVTRIGARKQIEARLLEKLHDDPNVIISKERETEIYLAAQYLAGLTLESLAEMFQSAKEIMDWLGTCAKLVSMQKSAVSWVTPLGLPVVQPYRKTQMHTIQTVLQTITLTLQADYLPVSLSKQKSAFPPNFVHSMDATHMLMTCKKMIEKDYCFAAVHDSYWTHPCDIDFMNESLREAFVQLYEQPILEDLRDSLSLRYPEIQFPPVPDRGTLDIKGVKESKYFFH